MKYGCTYCGRMAADGHLWCEQFNCPAGHVPKVLGYGEYLGDIKILRLLRLFRTAAVYIAERGEETIMLKVAHEGHEDNLRKEALALTQFSNPTHYGLPKLQMPYLGTAKSDPYGKAVFRGETKYYELFEYVQGEFLRDLLLENPQPWYQHSAWIMLGLATTIDRMHRQNVAHFNLSPDVILVRRDRDNIPRTVLLDLGLVSEVTTPINASLVRRIEEHGLPSYTPPELLKTGTQTSHACDVYGLGLIFYELLAGEPAFPYKLRQNEAIRADVSKLKPDVPIRRDAPQPDRLKKLIQISLNKDPKDRPAHVGEIGKEIIQIFGKLPVERKTWRSRFQRQTLVAATILALVGAVIAISMLLIAATSGGAAVASAL